MKSILLHGITHSWMLILIHLSYSVFVVCCSRRFWRVCVEYGHKEALQLMVVANKKAHKKTFTSPSYTYTCTHTLTSTHFLVGKHTEANRATFLPLGVCRNAVENVRQRKHITCCAHETRELLVIERRARGVVSLSTQRTSSPLGSCRVGQTAALPVMRCAANG